MTAGDQQDDEQAIRALIDRQVTAWAAGDPAAYASVFTTDADYITFLGSRHVGRDAIAASYVPLFRKLLNRTQLRVDIAGIRFLRPDVALIHANASVVRAGRRPSRRNGRVNTSVAVRTDGRWQLVASQNTAHRWIAEKLMAKCFS